MSLHEEGAGNGWINHEEKGQSAERMIMEDEDRGGSRREAALALDAMPTKGIRCHGWRRKIICSCHDQGTRKCFVYLRLKDNQTWSKFN